MYGDAVFHRDCDRFEEKKTITQLFTGFALALAVAKMTELRERKMLISRIIAHLRQFLLLNMRERFGLEFVRFGRTRARRCVLDVFHAILFISAWSNRNCVNDGKFNASHSQCVYYFRRVSTTFGDSVRLRAAYLQFTLSKHSILCPWCLCFFCCYSCSFFALGRHAKKANQFAEN